MKTSDTRLSRLAVNRLLPVGTIFITAFFLHFVWEMWQVPFYDMMMEANHWQAVQFCTQATVGDALIASLAYGASAWWCRDARWLLSISRSPLLLYTAIGVVITLILEYLATEVYGRWVYSELMPRLPGLGTGLVPVLQWLILPFLTLFGARIFYRGLTAHPEEPTYGYD